MRGNIYITGFMGAGKTVVGSRLAHILRRPFVDMDELIANESGMSVHSFFETRGENQFRDMETRLLERLAGQNGLVISTGGGVPERAVNRRIMRKSGAIVYLHTPLDECLARVRNDAGASRPLCRENNAVRALYERRAAAYADHDVQVNTSKASPDDAAWRICETMRPELSITVQLGWRRHDLVLAWKLSERLSPYMHKGQAFVITDARVQKALGSRLNGVLDNCPLISLRPGERSKTFGTVKRLYESMLRYNLERGGFVIAIGGGVVTDVGAFVASTYKRGIPFILVSTSLVGCVDAAIGGKAAVNLNDVKNAVGCFTAPEAVILDLRAISSLPTRNIIDGLVEAYKTGLVAEPGLAALVEEELHQLLKGDLLLLTDVIRLSASAKARVVKKDFKDTGLRRILNFGHTYGHAVESAHGYRVSHGAAVAFGMMVAVSLSLQRGLLRPSRATKVLSTLECFVPQRVELPRGPQAWSIMRNDKKNAGGHITFVLLAGDAHPLIVDDVTPDELEQAIQEVERLPHG